MLVFYSPDNLERLANAQTFFMDGTFSVSIIPQNSLKFVVVVVERHQTKLLYLSPMPQSTVMPEPATCARAGTTSYSTW
jgi:hypothetical protein